MNSRFWPIFFISILTIMFVHYESPNITFLDSLLDELGVVAYGHIVGIDDEIYGSNVTIQFYDQSQHSHSYTSGFFFSQVGLNRAKDLMYASSPVRVHYLSFCPALFSLDEPRSELFYSLAVCTVAIALTAALFWLFLLPPAPQNRL